MTQLEDFSIEPPTNAQGYLSVAKEMLVGARSLLNVDPLPTFAITLLCGHGVEAALKSLLTQKGLTPDELKHKPYGHNLIALWNQAVERGAKVDASVPEWINHLNRLVIRPNTLRYPLGVHGVVLPNQQDMVAGLERLVFCCERVGPVM